MASDQSGPGGFPQQYPPRPAPSRGCFGIGLLLLVLAGGGFFVLILLASLGNGLSSGGFGDTSNSLTEKFHSLNRNGTDKIAILQIDGVMTEAEDGFTKRQIDHIREDKSVKAILIRVNSPGGLVNAADYQYHHLKKLIEDRKLPTVVSMGALCASGGYYAAMAVGAQDTKEDVIFAEPTTWSGSIGVIIPHYDASELAKMIGVKEDSVKSHPLKGLGDPLRPMTEEERKIFESLVNESFTRFKSIVTFGRPKMPPENMDKVATGQIFTTAQAIEFGLVDKEGYIEDAIARTIEIAKLSKDSVRVVKYERQKGLFEILMSGQASASGLERTLSMIVDSNAPRAWYLWSWAPPASKINH